MTAKRENTMAAAPTMIVHHLHHGFTPCGMRGVPRDWPEGHKWSADWKDVTCPDCIKAGRE